MAILHHLSITIWRYLFGRSADSLEQSMDNDDEYMIYDDRPIASSFCNVRSVDAFVSGIIAGILGAAGFGARVSAHSVGGGGGDEGDVGGDASGGGRRGGSGGTGGLLLPDVGPRERCVFLVKFNREVMERDAALER